LPLVLVPFTTLSSAPFIDAIVIIIDIDVACTNASTDGDRGWWWCCCHHWYHISNSININSSSSSNSNRGDTIAFFAIFAAM